MAIYHFSAKVISRANGSSALAAAAYRSASRLHDQRLDRDHDFSNKAGVVHSEVMLPAGAPDILGDREQLWNEVERVEIRKDAQLAREVEFAIPRELDQAEGIRLARDFVEREFVARGMIADLNVHWDVGEDGEPKPHAHVMLTMREVSEDGFGAKVRDWNRTELLEHWREAWAEHTNQRLAELDIDARIDHRSLEAQGIDLEPQHKIGAAASRMVGEGLDLERVEEHRAIARANGAKLLAQPALALDAITHGQATFTTRDLAKFVHRHSDGKDQFDQVMAAVRAAPELVKLGKDGRGEERFTSRAMLETEQRLERATATLEARRRHIVQDADQDRALARAASRRLHLSAEQRDAFSQVTKPHGLSTVIGYAGTGKSAMLGVAREAWEAAGYHVQGAALSGIAAEGLETGSGIHARTIASLEHQWAQDRELLTDRHVLVIDEAGMIGTRQMERVIAEAAKRGAKVVLVGDPEQLQAIEAGAAFRSIAERYGSYELTNVRRQREAWQRDATRWLATERTGEALAAYAEHESVHAAETREQARADLVDRWDRDRQAAPDASRIILTHTNDEVQGLNALAREHMREAGVLGDDIAVRTERGARDFAAGDRILFLKNERGLGVKNGSLGTVDSVSTARMAVLFDDGRSVAFDLKDYDQIDHGYAATIHKAQGMTVDRVHVLATPGLDRHAAYVALSRHRDRVDLHYGQDDFANQGKLVRTLSRERGKDMASDYLEKPDARELSVSGLAATPNRRARDPFSDLDLQPIAKAAERVAAERAEELSRTTVQGSQASDITILVQRYARAVSDVVRMREAGHAELPHQRIAFERAWQNLDQAKPHASRDLRAAFNRDMGLIDEAARGRTANALRAMQLEAEMRQNPQMRADRFVEDWRQLQRNRSAFQNAYDERGVQRIERQMGALAKGIDRDAQAESLVRKRLPDLGIELKPTVSLSQGIQDYLGLSRSRGLGR